MVREARDVVVLVPDDDDDDDVDLVICDGCDSEIEIVDVEMTYCPYCGSDLDEDDGDED